MCRVDTENIVLYTAWSYKLNNMIKIYNPLKCNLLKCSTII